MCRSGGNSPVKYPVLVLLIILAGCVSSTSAEPPRSSPIPAASSQAAVEVKSINFSVRGASVAFDGEPNGGNVDVPASARGLLAEAHWSCTAGPCDLNLIMIKPGNSESESAQGSGSARLVVQDIKQGRWNAQVRPTSVIDAHGVIRVSIFADREVPLEYSAFS